MDILSLLGIIIAVASILVGQALEGGHIGSILQLTAFMIVMGGTIGAVMLNYPMPIFMKALASMKMVFVNVHTDLKGTIAEIVEMSNISRKQGLLALEDKMKSDCHVPR